MTWLKQFVEDINKKEIVNNTIDPLEEQIKEFHSRLQVMQNQANEIINDSSLKFREKLLNQQYNDMKSLFVEVLLFIFNHEDYKNNSTIYSNYREEVLTPIGLPFRDKLGNLLYPFMNAFDIDRQKGNLNLNLDTKATISYKNDDFKNFLQLFNKYYFKQNNHDILKIQPELKKQNNKLKV